MAGFFCLGSRGLETPPPTTTTISKKQQEAVGTSEDHHHHHHHHHRNNNNLFLFRNEEIYNNNNKGFQIWHQQQPNHQNLNNFYSFGVVPSSRTTDRNTNNNNNNNNSVVVSDESALRFDFTMMTQGSLGSGTGGMNCQDCGNQAKKDCTHLRCRTCCKSRGFNCPTHVKSTWVPAAKRRERQQQLTALQQQQHLQNQQQFRIIDQHSKRHRDHQLSTYSTHPIPTNTSNKTSTGLELGATYYPPELNSEAVFRCVKMNSVDETSEQYAYQTAVNIGGHVFKGILYDQGPDSNYTLGCGGEVGAHQRLNLIATTTTSTIIEPEASLYNPTSFNAFMSGTPFFQSPRS